MNSNALHLAAARQNDLDLETPDLEDAAPDLDIYHEQNGAIAYAIKKARQRGWSRERIVARMNLCLPHLLKPLTPRQLDAWTAQSKENSEFPSRFLPAFCWATKCYAPIEIGPASVEFELINKKDSKALELGRISLARADLNKMERSIKRD